MPTYLTALRGFSLFVLLLTFATAMTCLAPTRAVAEEEPAVPAETKSDEKEAATKPAASPRPSVEEARARARMLHEAMHGALQVMHRDFFDEEESRIIPSHSLEDVFRGMGKAYEVEMAWLAVNADAMNIDNNPRDEFEKRAVKALTDGALEHAEVEEGRFRFVGAVQLSSRCLKCHVPYRKSTHDRVAGLVISMPIEAKE